MLLPYHEPPGLSQTSVTQPTHISEKLDTPEPIISECLDAISRADVLFAWIDSLDCYGALAEIGIARGSGKQVWVAVDDALDIPRATNLQAKHGGDGQHDLWFVCAMAHKRGCFRTPQDALYQWLPGLTEPMSKCARLSMAHPVDLQFGPPSDAITATFNGGRCRAMRKAIYHARWNYGIQAPVETIELAALWARSYRFW